MQEALTLMSMPGRLCFGKDGRWRHGSRPVTHAQIARYFSEHLRYSAEHSSWVIAVGGKCVEVEIEDTPYVVTTIETDTQPWQIRLNSGTVESFDPATVMIGGDNALYCRATEQRIPVRLLRPAMQRLWPLIAESSGAYLLQIDQRRYPITLHDTTPGG